MLLSVKQETPNLRKIIKKRLKIKKRRSRSFNRCKLKRRVSNQVSKKHLTSWALDSYRTLTWRSSSPHSLRRWKCLYKEKNSRLKLKVIMAQSAEIEFSPMTTSSYRAIDSMSWASVKSTPNLAPILTTTIVSGPTSYGQRTKRSRKSPTLKTTPQTL